MNVTQNSNSSFGGNSIQERGSDSAKINQLFDKIRKPANSNLNFR